ncbi:hypothetical protein GE21DRAFT_4991 [Neurospora crassa]|uniref:Uncharacterized protein n=1 Tax=Neurospora crassa (strain ATCC 24698 / 74-OR23-1A / CBS 708.71 / DSM 1257 / FGSC 987) TaxID=367110 RepID=Q7S3N3_NEUCR|nr:hypothetical protein NCU08210 [Neurospora crassa OR74A]EAA30064.1 hypothetical protein NCU08210 [Neurospora crassa OR74A]KHE86457.1 hypothetical protein GE21DRAFT_4991 [Neurospora crassa]|eukprot:XP_959300.1 hypothetical protein NCU08210 [Neurospora crassa OR74A]
MSSPSDNSRRSEMLSNQPPRLQQQGATVEAINTPQALNPQALNEEAARARAITDRVLANFRNEAARNPAVRNEATATSPDNLIETMNATLDAIRATAGNEPPPRPMRTARQTAIENRLGRLDELIRALRSRLPPNPNSAPPYTELPSEGEVTMAMSVPEPEYTPPYTPLGLFGQGQKRKREREVDYEEVEDDVDEEDRDFSRSCAPSPETAIPQKDTGCPDFAVEDDGDVSDEEEQHQEGNIQDENDSD